MAKAKLSPPKSGPKTMTLGLATFAKFSAMEGLSLSREQERHLRDLDRRGAPPEERRQELVQTYGKPHA